MTCPEARKRHRLETLVTAFTAQQLDCDCDGTLHKDAAWWLAQIATAWQGETVGDFRRSKEWALEQEVLKDRPPKEPMKPPEEPPRE